MVCLVTGLTVFASAPLRGGTGDDGDRVPDTLYTVPPIIVEAPRVTRGERDLYARSGFVAAVDLGERKDRVEDLSSVLSQMVGVRVRQYGGLGSFATVSIRGSSSNQVDLYLDGIPLSDAYTGVSNLGDLSLEGIESIEVYRGSSPPHLGSSSIGGVINLVTDVGGSRRQPEKSARVEARASYGSFDTRRYVLSACPSVGVLRGFLQGSYLETQGDFVFLDDRGTPQNPADDEKTVRTNNDMRAIDLLARVEGDVPLVGEVSLGHSSFLRENGVPGIGSNPSETAWAERVKHITYLRLDPGKSMPKRFKGSVGGYFSTGNEKFRDLEGDISLAEQDTDNDFRTYGANLRSDLDLHPVTLELFWDGKNERFCPRSKIPTPTEGPDRTREALVTAVSGGLYLDRLDLVLTCTERFHSHTSEFYDPPTSLWLPPQPQGKTRRESRTTQFGFRWLPTGFLTIKGNWGEHYRVPTFLELFGNAGSVTGSSGLEPEEGVNRDIGAVVSFDHAGAWRSLFFEVVYLSNEVDNLILFFPNSQFTSRPQNVGAAVIKGWETTFSATLEDWLRLSGNYTYLDGEDTGPVPYYHGNELPGRPQHDLGLFCEVVYRVARLSYEYHRIGRNYLDPANLMTVPARDIHNAALRWSPVGRRVSFTVEGRNLSDNRVSDVNGFPLPGRSLFFTVRYR